MKKVFEFIRWFFYITTCVLFVCAANVQISGTKVVSTIMLWEILLTGLITSIVTVLLRPGEWDSVRISIIKIIVHYLVLCGVMIVCGCWFDWMALNAQGIVMMMISVAVVYLLVYSAGYLLDRKQADEINQRLKGKYRD